MQELIRQLTERTGISEAQAEQAIETITAFIKDKLPPMMHGVVDNFLGQKPAGDNNPLDQFKDIFGGQQ